MRICVYGASSNDISPIFINAGEHLGYEMAKRNIGLTFGGGANGMMGAVARGITKGDGNIIGVAPKFFNVDGVLYEHCDEMIRPDTMRQRKHFGLQLPRKERVCRKRLRFFGCCVILAEKKGANSMATLETLKSMVTGAVRIWEADGWFLFSRFTEHQEEILRRRGFAPRQRASAGMRLEFTTRGGELAFAYEMHPGSGREYCGIEIAEDGLGMHHVYYDRVPQEGCLSYPIAQRERAVRVTVYFPNLAELRIRSLALPEDAVPCVRRRKYLAGMGRCSCGL